MTVPTSEQLAWCDRVADYFTASGGLPPITGRTIAWLMLCEPAEQSAADIAEAIGASRASLTSTLRLLVASGLVRRSSRTGTRTAYYRIHDEAWSTALRQRFTTLTSFLGLLEDGRRLVDGDAARLDAADDVYRWFADEIEPMRERWEQREHGARASDEDRDGATA